jgi:O-antigen ligase
VPLVIGAVMLAVAVRPSVMPRGMRVCDAALLAILLVGAAQLVPLPRAARFAVAPALTHVDRVLYLDADNPESRRWAPLSIDRSGTVEAVALAASGLLIFFSARALFAGHALRLLLRTVAICGLIASGLAIVQHAVAPSLLYGLWPPASRSASPYTPFVNRNDLAAWLILAIPLTAGYLLSRIESQRRGRPTAPGAALLDDTTAWLFGGLTAMTAALMVSMSRAGLTGAAASVVLFTWLSGDRISRRGRAALLAGMALIVLSGFFYASSGALMMRVQETLATGVGGRREIWDTTLQMIRDFPLTGVGIGAYARAVSVYQAPHEFSFNHAHNEYLQILAEGGIPLAAVVGIAVVAGVARARAMLRADRSASYWIRAGAVSSVFAIAVQSIWETGLRMPANAMLFAACCAAALTRSSVESSRP